MSASRVQLLERLAPVESLEEIVVPKSGGVSEFRVKDDGLYWQADGLTDEYKVSKESAVQALRHVPGLSGAAIKEWPTQLLLEPLNWWYQNGEGNVRALVNENELVSFTKRADHGIHSPTRILEAVEEGLEQKGVAPESLYFDKIRVGLDRVSFAVITHDKAEEVKAGDILNGGIMVFGSPTGESYIEVSPYLNRLVCTNGMVSPVHMGRFSHRGGDGGSIYDWAKEMTLSSWDAIDGELESLRSLTDVPVNGNIHNVFSDLFERHRIPAAQREAILEAGVEENDGTMFGISQAFNRVANNMDDVGQMRHLMMVTGDVAHQTERCSTCLRVVN